jgi:hypothetical protein
VQEADGEMNLVEQSLPDWPWQFVDTTELADSLLAYPKGKQNKKLRGKSPDIVLPERPKVRNNKKAVARA